MIPVGQKAKGITRNMVMPRPDLPYYMLNTLTKAKIPYDEYWHQYKQRDFVGRVIAGVTYSAILLRGGSKEIVSSIILTSFPKVMFFLF